MTILQFKEEYQEEVVGLILSIQNDEAGIDLSIDDQPDLLHIRRDYIERGGNFWIALDDEGKVAGTIAAMKIDDEWCALKKFFVRKDCRSKKVGLQLFREFESFVRNGGYSHVVLDTPSVAPRSHSFYEKAGFRRVEKGEIPGAYHFPDRQSLIFRLDLMN